MKEIIKLKNPSPEITAIFDFVVKNQFDDLTPLSKIRKSIDLDIEFQKQWTELSDKERILYLTKIRGFRFSNKKKYEVLSGNQQDFYDCMNTLTKFKEELIFFIEGKYEKNQKPLSFEIDFGNPGYFKPRPQPKDSGRSYGTLFE